MNIREHVYQKCGGRCAYCGRNLGNRWHVDHVEPLHRGNPSMGGSDTLDNCLPACARCNLWKKTFSIEQFRNEISKQVERVRRYSPGFRLAEDFGLIKEINKKVVFYFEQPQEQKEVITKLETYQRAFCNLLAMIDGDGGHAQTGDIQVDMTRAADIICKQRLEITQLKIRIEKLEIIMRDCSLNVLIPKEQGDE